MVKSEAIALAVMRWGINGFAVRANDINPAARYRVGFASNHEGKARLYILGMGRTWEEAFSKATEHPENEKQQQKATELRKQFEFKKAALTSKEEAP